LFLGYRPTVGNEQRAILGDAPDYALGNHVAALGLTFSEGTLLLEVWAAPLGQSQNR